MMPTIDETRPWEATRPPHNPWITWEVARRQAERAKSEKFYQELSRKLDLPALPKLPTVPGWARWDESIHVAWVLLDMVNDEMQDYIDARSDQWQEGDRGTAFMERHEAVEAVLDDVRSLPLDFSPARPTKGKPGPATPASDEDDPFAD